LKETGCKQLSLINNNLNERKSGMIKRIAKPLPLSW
jgi:hypothetical protein